MKKRGESLFFFDYAQRMQIECTLAYNLCPMKEKQLLDNVSDLKQIMLTLQEKWSRYEDAGSLYEYLVENTQPTSGTWDEWHGWFFYEWMIGDDNTFDGRKFYYWLLENYF